MFSASPEFVWVLAHVLIDFGCMGLEQGATYTKQRRVYNQIPPLFKNFILNKILI